MTDKEVRDAVRKWVADVMGIIVIQSYQGQNEPAEPYGVLNLIQSDSVRESPVDQEFPTTGEGDTEVISQAPVLEWFWRYSLNVYGGEGGTLLRKLRTAMHVPTAYESLRPLSAFELSAVRNVPEMLNEEWRARAQADIEIRGLVRDGLVIDVVEKADRVFVSV